LEKIIMKVLKHFDVQTKRLRMAGLESQNGDTRRVIALHGWLDNAASFLPLAKFLSGNYSFSALELPGHGKSEHRPVSCHYNLVDNVLDVLAYIDACEDGCEFDLLGHSLGGIVACLVAAAVPERVGKLVLLDSLGPLTDEIEQVLPQLRKAVAKAAALRGSKLNIYSSPAIAAKARMAGIGKITLPAAALLVERGTIPVDGGITWSSDPRLLEPSLLRFSESQVKAIFLGIECPVLLIVGDKGYFREYESIAKRLSYVGKLEKHIVEGGHHFHMEGDVEKTAEIVDAFLAS
jgi:pimeloyl-ACP methyl ester carboxylesterase